MSKARVWELAQKYGVDSKDIIKKLESIKEYVKSASSTVEAPVVRKLEKAFPELAAAAASAPATEPAKKVASGERAVMAHIDFGSPVRVGKYGVNLENLHRVGLPVMKSPSTEPVLFAVKVKEPGAFVPVR